MKCVALLACLLLPIANVLADDAPSYRKSIQPFLDRYCVQCHGASRPKSGVRLDSYQALMTGRKKTVTPGQPEESRLVKTLTGQGRLMPPKKAMPRPTSAEIDQVKAWIKAGAKDDSPKTSLEALELRFLAWEQSASPKITRADVEVAELLR